MSTTPAINFLGQDWANFRSWLLEEQQDTYKRLVAISNTTDTTQQLRGRALFIEQLLDLHRDQAAD